VGVLKAPTSEKGLSSSRKEEGGEGAVQPKPNQSTFPYPNEGAQTGTSVKNATSSINGKSAVNYRRKREGKSPLPIRERSSVYADGRGGTPTRRREIQLDLRKYFLYFRRRKKAGWLPRGDIFLVERGGHFTNLGGKKDGQIGQPRLREKTL